jgi:hypothetical protein
MKVEIKQLAATIEIKNTGIELDVSDTDDTHLGDPVITKTKLIWCNGKTRPENGKPISWTDFIAYMNGR